MNGRRILSVLPVLSAACLGLCLLTAAPLALAQSSQSNQVSQASQAATPQRPAAARSAQPGTAAYQAAPARQREASEGRRKPRWFDERRQEKEQQADVATAAYERLSYTQYQNDAGLGSGSCVYFQNTYTYSCR